MRTLFLEKQRRRYSVGLKNQIVMLLISPMLFLMLFVLTGLLMLKHIFPLSFIANTYTSLMENKTRNRKSKN